MRVVSIGTGDIGLPVLHWLGQGVHELVGVVTQPDKPVGREQRIQSPPIKVALAGSAVPILQPERIKRPEAIEAIRAWEPDVIVVMAYGQILPRAVLEIPRVACLNLHASLLPKHRGAAPIQAAIRGGDSETGITVMYMDEGLDTGDVLLERRIPILPNETGGSLHDRLAEIAPVELEEALTQLDSGTAARIPQNNELATYAPKLEREHGQINWSQSAVVIERTIRAFDPWPGTYILVSEDSAPAKKLKIFGSTLGSQQGLAPGQFKITDCGGLAIGAGDGALELGDVQLEGKKRMSAAALLRGHAWMGRAKAL